MAEKKSTTKAKSTRKAVKPTEKKSTARVRKPKSASEVQPTVEQANKPREINWNIVGLFSALFPLIGTGVLFMIGWAYEVNWYGYFGVNVNQVNISAQNILIQSVPAIITFLVSIVLATLTYYFLNTTFSYFGRLIQRARRKELLDQKVDDQKFSRTLYGARDWLFINFLTLVFLFAFLGLNYPNLLKPLEITPPYEIYYLQFLFLFSLFGLVPLILSIVIFIVLFGFASIIFLIQKRFKKMIAKQPFFYKMPQLAFLILITFSVTVMTLLALAASYGINDAAKGYRGSGQWNVQKVLIISPPARLITNNGLFNGCTETGCIYGPFGLIGENEHSYILIEWKNDKKGKFLRNPGLFIIPRSESTYLIPASP